MVWYDQEPEPVLAPERRLNVREIILGVVAFVGLLAGVFALLLPSRPARTTAALLPTVPAALPAPAPVAPQPPPALPEPDPRATPAAVRETRAPAAQGPKRPKAHRRAVKRSAADPLGGRSLSRRTTRAR